MDSDKEKKLFIQATDGDSRAFDSLIEEYKDDIEKCARAVLRNTTLIGVSSDDIVSEVLIELGENMQRQAPPQSQHPFRAWALTVTRFRAIDLKRDNARESIREQSLVSGPKSDLRLLGLFASVPFRDSDITELDHAAREDTLDRLRSAIDGLDSEDQAVVLGWLEGNTTRQIAAELKIDAGTVSRRFKRACLCMYSRLGPFKDNESPGLGDYRKHRYVKQGQWSPPKK
ncbi:MAG: RNA polymerase sigma factor [Phycisphaerales bacterium]